MYSMDSPSRRRDYEPLPVMAHEEGCDEKGGTRIPLLWSELIETGLAEVQQVCRGVTRCQERQGLLGGTSSRRPSPSLVPCGRAQTLGAVISKRWLHVDHLGVPTLVEVDKHRVVQELGIRWGCEAACSVAPGLQSSVPLCLLPSCRFRRQRTKACTRIHVTTPFRPGTARYRDLLILDPSIPTPSPSTLLIRDRALVVNLEAVRMIITANQVFLLSGGQPGGGAGGEDHAAHAERGRGLGVREFPGLRLDGTGWVAHPPRRLPAAAPPRSQCPRRATRAWRRSPPWTTRL